MISYLEDHPPASSIVTHPSGTKRKSSAVCPRTHKAPAVTNSKRKSSKSNQYSCRQYIGSSVRRSIDELQSEEDSVAVSDKEEVVVEEVEEVVVEEEKSVIVNEDKDGEGEEQLVNLSKIDEEMVIDSKVEKVYKSMDDYKQSNICICPRYTALTAESWWLIKKKDVKKEYNRTREGAAPLVSRCMRNHGWSFAHAERILKAYRQFLILKKEYKDWNADILSPSPWVDVMWHEHISDVINYCHDTMLLCGRVVGHNPNGALDGWKKERDNTTRASLRGHFGVAEYDEEVWYSRQEWRVKVEENKRSKQKSLDNLAKYMLHHQVYTKPQKKNYGDFITIIMKGKNIDDVHLIKFGRMVKMENVFAWYKKKFHPGFIPSNLYFQGYGHFQFRGTAQDLKLVDGDELHMKDVSDNITVRIKDQTREETYYKVRYNTKMRTIFRIHAQRKGVESLRFLLNGDKLYGYETPFDLELDDGDQIDCMLDQTKVLKSF